MNKIYTVTYKYSKMFNLLDIFYKKLYNFYNRTK